MQTLARRLGGMLCEETGAMGPVVGNLGDRAVHMLHGTAHKDLAEVSVGTKVTVGPRSLWGVVAGKKTRFPKMLPIAYATGAITSHTEDSRDLLTKTARPTVLTLQPTNPELNARLERDRQTTPETQTLVVEIPQGEELEVVANEKINPLVSAAAATVGNPVVVSTAASAGILSGIVTGITKLGSFLAHVVG